MINQAVIVAIAGGSGSGKTTFAEALAAELSQLNPLLLSIDHYYRDLSHMPIEARHSINFDHPDAIEQSLLREHIALLRQGKNITRPCYDFATHTRLAETVNQKPSRVVLLDGIFALCDQKLYDLIDIKLFIDVDDDLRLMRRIRRDIESRGRTFESVTQQYFATVKPMYQQFIEPCKWQADLIIPWEKRNFKTVKLVAHLITGR